MKIFSGINEKNNSIREGMISIGVFDALHIGHQKLLSDMVIAARESNLETYVLTFRIPPKKDNELNILELNDKLSYIENIGIDNVIVCDFDEHFSTLPAIEFIRILEKNFTIRAYFIGSDFKFGHNKSGSKELIEQLGYNVLLEDTLQIDNKKVSTSQIKKYIKEGKVEGIKELLGRYYYIKGIVKMGKQLGRVLGFPTMNIINPQVLYPSNGAYISLTEIDDTLYESMTFVDSSIIETHLLNYSDFNYNFQIKIHFTKKIRDNLDFKNFDDLKKQLENDLLVTKQYFKYNK